ncbi:hypothetical protein GCM10020260_01820 [Nesterenkonia halobia]|uniref:Uncharacterized protein n=1 Tax=Nesterenkonia halobia TaxID=37922 RepID=A0ABP6R6T0_9MICC
MVCWIGSARAPVTGSGSTPEWICWVSKLQVGAVFSVLLIELSVQCGRGDRDRNGGAARAAGERTCHAALSKDMRWAALCRVMARACPAGIPTKPGRHPGHPTANWRVAGQQTGVSRWHS